MNVNYQWENVVPGWETIINEFDETIERDQQLESDSLIPTEKENGLREVLFSPHLEELESNQCFWKGMKWANCICLPTISTLGTILGLYVTSLGYFCSPACLFTCTLHEYITSKKLQSNLQLEEERDILDKTKREELKKEDKTFEVVKRILAADKIVPTNQVDTFLLKRLKFNVKQLYLNQNKFNQYMSNQNDDEYISQEEMMRLVCISDYFINILYYREAYLNKKFTLLKDEFREKYQVFDYVEKLIQSFNNYELFCNEFVYEGCCFDRILVNPASFPGYDDD